jgi:nucleoside-diphosphate-sugar epimerase
VEKTNLWISGSRGFIGKYLVNALGMDPKYQVRCITNNSSTTKNVTYIDFSDINSIRKVVDLYGIPDVFVHLGWGAVYEPQSDIHIGANVFEGKNLIDELFECGLEKFVLLGSSSEYGDREGALSEDMSGVGKLTAYVNGKTQVSEYGFAKANQLNKIFIHIKLFYAFGAGQHENSLINQLYRNFVEKSVMNLSPCEHFRDYIYVSDVVEGIIRISKANRSAIVNLGSGRVIQLRDFVERFWKCLGGEPDALKFGAHEKPAHEPGQPRSYADLSILKGLTDWIPSVSLDDGIMGTVHLLRGMS